MAGSQDFKTALASLPENLSEQVETYLRREPNAGTKKEMEEMVAAGKIEVCAPFHLERVFPLNAVRRTFVKRFPRDSLSELPACGEEWVLETFE